VITCAVVGEIVRATGRTIVTEAVADFEESATEVALTETCAELGTAAGAVYRPLVEMVPHAVPVQPLPLMLQVTAEFVVLATVAVNCRWLPVTTVAVVGEIVTATGATIVTEATADFVGSATEVALTDTCAGLGTAAGAVYCPVEDIVPQADPVQPLPLTLQLTALFVVLAIVAVNC
jgi:uncharacterized spore protein YtfJ